MCKSLTKSWCSAASAIIGRKVAHALPGSILLGIVFLLPQSSFSQHSMLKEEAQSMLRQLQTSVANLTKDAKAIEQKASAALPNLEQRQQKLAALLSDSLSAATADLQQQWQEKTETFKSLLAKPDSLLAQMPLGAYSSRIDSLTGMLRFLAQQSSEYPPACNELLQQVQAAQGLLAGTEQYTNFLDTYREQLGQALSLQGLLDKTLPPAWKKFTAQAADIKAQVATWKETINDPEKLEQMALATLRKSKWFEQFMQQNSELARLFGSVGGSPAGSPATPLPGLQTTQSMGQLLTERFGSSEQAMAAIREQAQKGVDKLQTMQQSLNEVKDAAEKATDLFDHKQKERASLKAKPFKQRLEKGWNIQQTPGRYGFPATNDIGLSLGYVFSRNGIFTVGVAGQLGLGSWQKITFNIEGLVIRTSLDWRLSPENKGLLANTYVTGGWDFTKIVRTQMQPPVPAAPDLGANKPLIGVSKTISVKGKRKIKVSVLYSLRYIPNVSPFQFRYSYSL